MIKQITFPAFILLSLYLHAQNLGVGVVSPLGTLDVARGTALNGTAMFRGTLHASHFNYGTTEDTYIRGGKPGSHVIINDAANMGNVGIGLTNPAAKLHISGLSPELLRLQGLTPYISLYDLFTPTGYLQAYGSDLLLGTFFGNTTGALKFYNNNVVNMTILANGNIGIGTSTPAARLNIAQDNEALRLTGNQSYISFYNGNAWKGYLSMAGTNNMVLGTAGANDGELYLAKNGVVALTVQSDARVKIGSLGCNLLVGSVLLQYPKFSVHGPIGIKNTTGDQVGEWAFCYDYTLAGGDLDDNNLAFFFNGGKKAWIDDVDGDYHSVSDSRLKEDLEHCKSVLNGLKKLDVYTYHYSSDDTGKISFGLVAQNVREYFPELVSGSEENGSYLGIAYAKTGVLAIKAVQEQQEMIEDQQAMIEDLKKEIAELKRLIHKRDL